MLLRYLLVVGLVLPLIGRADPIPEEAIPRFGGCYFAPVSIGKLWRMRDQDGAIREFEPHARTPNLLVGYGGWTAMPDDGDGGVKVQTPVNLEPRLVFHFRKGKLSEAEIDGKRCRFSYPEPLVYEDSHIVPLWPEASEDAEEKFKEKMAGRWNFENRFKFGFDSPNQAAAVISILFLACLAIVLDGSTLLRRVFAAVAGAALLVMLVMTASRGGMAAVVAGAVPLWVCHLKKAGRLSTRTFVRALICVVFVAAAAIGVSYVKVRSKQGDTASDSLRLELLQRAPRMLYDAPGGWGSSISVGRAYTDWYQPDQSHRKMFSLVNDHLTTVVALGWLKGGLYVLGWIAGLVALWLLAWRGGSSIPAAAWTALGVASVFNVVLYVRYVSWFAFATLPLTLVDRRLRCLNFWKRPLGVGLIGTAVVMMGLYLVAVFVPVSVMPLHHDGGRTVINGNVAETWLVVDPEMLDPESYKAEMRRFFERNRTAQPLGFVKSLDDLPSEGVSRLVLAGKEGAEFLTRYKAGRITRLPKEIVFLAPAFGCFKIPGSLRTHSDVQVVIGEFAARYFEDYATPCPWVTLVEGAECYIPGWMCFVMKNFKE